MSELREIVLSGQGEARPNGGYEYVNCAREAYIADLVGDFKLHDMADAVRESGADLALGFDGDGDR